jgi:hypothetical protein
MPTNSKISKSVFLLQSLTRTSPLLVRLLGMQFRSFYRYLFRTLLLPSSSLPSEALEEFLSILRPTFFSPTSPILRARLHGSTISLPNIPSERPYPFKSRGRIEVVHRKTEPNDIMLVGGGAGAEDNNNSNNNTERTHHPTSQTILDISSSSTPESASDKGESGGAEFDIDFLATRWNASHCHCTRHEILSFSGGPDLFSVASPISRMQTRNPFQRHPSYEMPSSPTSPLAPTPDPLLLSPLDEVPEGS